jgi:T-complex protein 1 subunit eta
LAGEFLLAAKQFVEDGVHPQIIIRSFRQALTLATGHLQKIAVDISKTDTKERESLLIKCGKTALNSKLIGGVHKDFFAKMVSPFFFLIFRL